MNLKNSNYFFCQHKSLPRYLLITYVFLSMCLYFSIVFFEFMVAYRLLADIYISIHI